MLGYPIRTPSDHSSVDNSPRTIAASHVLHRLLMPRHPPCALTHLTTPRCSHPLCNTQHTTTPRTPHHHHHTHTRDALDGPGPEAAPEKTTHQPARCLLRTQQCVELVYDFWRYVPPSHTPQRAQGCGINKKETRDHMSGFAPPIRGSSLERR